MGENSAIEWTHHTFNPVWGCVKVSPACTHCYAEMLANRWGHQVWGPKAPRRTFGDKHWREPLAWDKAAEAAGERRRVFCASMADVFEDHPDWVEPRRRLWELIEITPHLDWLLLTKRPENVTGMVPLRWLDDWPRNVWAGTTVENQEYADKRIPELLRVPAAVRFLSCEPLLGPVDLLRTPRPGEHHDWLTGERETAREKASTPRIDWVIAGGESGPGARPSHPDWFRSLRDQCQAAGVPFHFKQWGNWQPRNCMTDAPDDVPDQWTEGEIPLLPDGTDCRGMETMADARFGCRVMRNVGKKAAGRLLDGRTWDEFPEVVR